MNKYLLIITLLPFVLFAQNEMKCEAGKCAGGKNVPTKQKNKTNTPRIEQLFNVRTIDIKQIDTAKKQSNHGYIVAQDPLKIDVTPWYSGFVHTLYANALYKKVHKGDALAKVYSAEVYKAKQDYLNSIKYNKRTPMPEMLKSAKTKLVLLGVAQKEIQEIRQTHTVDKYTTIYAPIDGWIFEKNIYQGSSFTSKKRLFQIVNLENVWVEVKLFQNEIESLQTLKNFRVKITGIDKEYIASNPLLYPMMNPKEATATLRLEIKNTDGLLKPGMYANVEAWEMTHTRIVIPRTAVIRKSGTWYAFLATEFKGEYEPIKIEVQPLDALYFEVLSGLHVGDSVVNNALFMMDSDAQINSIY